MILIEENKSRKLGSQKVEKNTDFISFDKFFDCFNYAKKDNIWWLF